MPPRGSFRLDPTPGPGQLGGETHSGDALTPSGCPGISFMAPSPGGGRRSEEPGTGSAGRARCSLRRHTLQGPQEHLLDSWASGSNQDDAGSVKGT